MIEKFIEELCEILGIDNVKISHDTSMFPTETTLAQYASVDNTIRVIRFKQPTPDLMFAIAHELRHAWQIKYHEDMVGLYKASDEVTIEEYNLQEAELDANAFAVVVMANFFGIQPRFDGMPDKIRKEIFERASKIALD